MGRMLHLSVFALVDCLLQCLPYATLFREASQPAHHLAGQAQNLLRPKHQIHFSLVLALNFDKHLRKSYEEVSNPRTEQGFCTVSTQ